MAIGSGSTITGIGKKVSSSKTINFRYNVATGSYAEERAEIIHQPAGPVAIYLAGNDNGHMLVGVHAGFLFTGSHIQGGPGLQTSQEFFVTAMNNNDDVIVENLKIGGGQPRICVASGRTFWPRATYELPKQTSMVPTIQAGELFVRAGYVQIVKLQEPFGGRCIK